jgi:N-methylhydantoinase A
LFGRTVAASLEVITWRLRSSGGKDQVTRPHAVADALKGKRSVYFNELGAYVETPVYDHYKLPLDQPVKGPAIIEQRESTAVVGPSGIAHVDGHGNLVINIL